MLHENQLISNLTRLQAAHEMEWPLTPTLPTSRAFMRRNFQIADKFLTHIFNCFDVNTRMFCRPEVSFFPLIKTFHTGNFLKLKGVLLPHPPLS